MPKMPSETEVAEAYTQKIEQMAREGTRGTQMQQMAARVIACVVEESLKAWPAFVESWPEIQKRLGEVDPALKAIGERAK